MNDYGNCADCGCKIGEDDGPPDGWQLAEDGRTVCNACCVINTKDLFAKMGFICADRPTIH